MAKHRAPDRREKGLFGRVWDAVRGKALDQGVWSTGPVTVMGQPLAPWQNSSELWRNFTIQEKERVMQSCSIVFSCVWAIMQGSTKAPLELGQQNAKGEWEKVAQHPLLNLMKTPNPCLSWSVILQRAVAHLEVGGRCHLWKWRNAKGEVAELWPVPPSWVTPFAPAVTSLDPSKRLVDHYDIQVPGGATYSNIQPVDVVTIQYGDPFSLTGCLPPLHAAMRDVQLATRHDDYDIERIANLKPTPVVRTKEAISDAQRDDLRATIRSRMGYDNSATAIVITGDQAAVEMVDAMEGMDWKRFRDLREANICAAFRVPPIVAGVVVGLENSPWSNMGEAKRWFFDGKIVPLWQMVEEGLTLGLLRQEKEPTLELWFNTSEVPELQEAADSVAARMLAGWSGGAVTRNEYRQALNLKPDTARGDVYMIAMGAQEEPANEKAPEPVVDEMTPEEHAAGAAEDIPGGDQDAGGKSLHPHKPRSAVTGQFNHPGGEHPATLKMPMMPKPEVVMPCEEDDTEVEPDEESEVEKPENDEKTEKALQAVSDAQAETTEKLLSAFDKLGARIDLIQHAADTKQEPVVVNVQAQASPVVFTRKQMIVKKNPDGTITGTLEEVPEKGPDHVDAQ